ncbi:hypothetical protein MH117_15025 [Paenibacillus sp. ACRRX]|uniref:hypothetical protein n=1 Tax=unclassified Paenibacillus TaxID=185978 RepID=UPI001EF75172|nr:MULTISPECIES: hypothetical protein [unclassified Paenibacillus]MCG7408743.1 hypothetical protein [Paenibacillus sp. ACRRX]MDK8183512.1 hypothetical protein [Paenibacillus sp. UMB4589-SE434]
MLSFEQKSAIADSFPELQRKSVSLGRMNYHYEQSVYDKKTVVYHLHPNGNGFVYAGHIKGYATDDKGMVNIRDLSADELRTLITNSIRSLAGTPSTPAEPVVQTTEERWLDADKHMLTLCFEDEDQMWYVYAGLNLDTVFETYEEAVDYLQEEGFTRVNS